MNLAVNIDERIYEWRVRRRRGAGNDAPVQELRTTALDEILPVSHRFVPEVSSSGFVYRLNDVDLALLNASEFDVLVRLGNGILQGGILTASKHGVLSFHHGDNRVNRGGPWGFWEVYERADTTGFILQRLTDKLDGGDVLVRRNYMTQQTVLRNRTNLIRRSYPILREVLLELAQSNELPVAELPFPYAGRLYRTPTVLQSLFSAVPNPWAIGKTFARQLFVNKQHEWRVGVTKQHWINASFRNFRLVPTHRGTWVADPFIISWAGQRGILMEEFVASEGKGRISYCELDESGRPSLPKPVLAESFHLSFPWTFVFEGELYMTPESYDARELRLYRCVEFPYLWEFTRSMMTGVAAVDPMIFERGDQWYLLINIDPLDAGDPNSELHVFTANDPVHGDWIPVTGSPSVVDPRQARNGGLLRDGDRLLRVGQRQEFGAYGMACGIYEITKLSPAGYSERLLYPLEARWEADLRGPHHVSSAGEFTAFDFAAPIGRHKARHE